MLKLTDWVHLSLRPDTPLLRDKLAKGYPHALLVFSRETVLSLPEVALLPYNTKAWRSRSAYVPITNPLAKAELLKQQAETKHFPSLEVLVHYGLSLSLLTRIVFASERERSLVTETLASCEVSCQYSLEIDAALLRLPEAYAPTTEVALHEYFTSCQSTGQLLPPPNIPFD